MRRINNFIILFLVMGTQCQCQKFNTTVVSVTVDYSLERTPRVDDKYHSQTSSSVVKLNDKSPEFILRTISQMSRKNIQELYLESNRLTNLPDTLVSLSQIESISLAENNISDITGISVIGRLPRLRNLVLSHNPLKSLTGLRIDSLEILEVDNCRIREIDGILPDSLPMLKTLDLTGNPLRSIRKLISESLTKLVLNNCQLAFLHPETFQGLSSLTDLDLRENKLNTMPDEIFLGNNNLCRLNLCKNQFKIIKNSWFNSTPNLETLNFSENEIISINATDFARLHTLVELDLSRNKVTALPDLETAAFEVNFSKNSIENKKVWDLSKMTRIRRLDLSHNQLKGNYGSFRSTSLRILILGHNRLTTLTKAHIANLPNLTDVNLRGNIISTGINPTVFRNTPNVVNVELGDNPWNCNCTQLFPMYFYLASGQRTKTSNLICSSPKNAFRRTWWEFCGKIWKGLMDFDDKVERGTTWIIVISASFGSCLIFGTMLYITYTFKKNRPVQIRDVRV